MVTIKKRKRGNREFFYLLHKIRNRKKTMNKEKYLGKSIPKNIEEIKRNFLREIYKKKWYSKLDLIKRNFKAEFDKLPKSVKEKQMEYFMIKFTYNTNRIEGSSLTYKETSNLLHNNISPSNRRMADIKEAENHKKVFYNMLEHKADLSLKLVLNWHWDFFKETKPDIAGKVRHYGVYVTGSKTIFPSPSEVMSRLRDFFRWYDKNKEKLHPTELAALAHLKFVSIHPFGDGNGRISRLIMNFVLKKYGFPMLDIPYSNRSSYYSALERSNLKKEEYIFVQYIIKRYLRDYKKYLKAKS